jgi:hypothetical protein
MVIRRINLTMGLKARLTGIISAHTPEANSL